MTDKSTVENKGGLTIVRFTSSPTARDLMDTNTALATSGPSRLRLWDLTCGIDMSTSELQIAAEHGRSQTLPTAIQGRCYRRPGPYLWTFQDV